MLAGLEAPRRSDGLSDRQRTVNASWQKLFAPKSIGAFMRDLKKAAEDPSILAEVFSLKDATNGRSLLHAAVDRSELGYVTQLHLAEGRLGRRILIDMRDDQGGTALHLAVEGASPSVEIIKALLDAKIAIDATTADSRRTALHQAAVMGKSECVQVLLAAGADKDLGDADDLTPLALATKFGQLDTVMILLEAQANASKKMDGRRLRESMGGFGAKAPSSHLSPKLPHTQAKGVSSEIVENRWVGARMGVIRCQIVLFAMRFRHQNVPNGVDRRCRPSVSGVGVVRRCRPLGVVRRGRPLGVGRSVSAARGRPSGSAARCRQSVSSVGIVRRHRPSASAVGEHRRALRKASFSHGAKRKFAEFGLL